MNLYFLVEGDSTEKKFYPALIQYIFHDRISKIEKIEDVSEDSDGYFVLSGNGYPQIYQILEDSIKDINTYRAFTDLFVCLDADEIDIPVRIKEFEEEVNEIAKSGTIPNENLDIHLIIQNRCIETWFLGNNIFYRRNSTNPDVLKFKRFYDVRIEDPELMGIDSNYELHAHYHLDYFRAIVRENRQVYSKGNASVVCQPSFVEQIIKRLSTPKHLNSFRNLINLLNHLNAKIVLRNKSL